MRWEGAEDRNEVGRRDIPEIAIELPLIWAALHVHSSRLTKSELVVVCYL